MHDLPPGMATDLAVLELTGSSIVDRGDHLIIRTPENPDFHWGNCVFVTDPGAVADAASWIATFHKYLPDAPWLAIGLVRMPDDQPAWATHGVDLELDEALTTGVQPSRTPMPAGYVVRRLAGDDWQQSVARAVAENLREGAEDPQSYQRFAERRVRSWRELSATDTGAFFGAFADDVLVAELGIVRCGKRARYQSVSTDRAHRQRGLAGHLLGVAAQWSAANGCDSWVIVTEADNPAGRLYRSVGFEPDTPSVRAYRRPSR